MDSIVEVAVLIICLIAYAAVRKSRKSSKGQKKNAAPPAGEKSGSFKEQMADLARDLAANDGDALDMLINELRSAPSEGPAEGESARRPRATGEIADGPQPAARLAQMPSAAPAPSSPQAPGAPRRAEAQPAPVDFAAARRKLRAKAKPADKKAAASAPAQAVRLDGLPSGESAVDAEGCVGGSLGAHREEGESRAEHRLHERRREAALAAECAASRRAAAVRQANVDQLRQAVVMSEILDKPKALRRR